MSPLAGGTVCGNCTDRGEIARCVAVSRGPAPSPVPATSRHSHNLPLRRGRAARVSPRSRSYSNCMRLVGTHAGPGRTVFPDSARLGNENTLQRETAQKNGGAWRASVCLFPSTSWRPVPTTGRSTVKLCVSPPTIPKTGTAYADSGTVGAHTHADGANADISAGRCGVVAIVIAGADVTVPVVS